MAVGQSQGVARGDLPVVFYRDRDLDKSFQCTLTNSLVVPGLDNALLSTSSLVDDGQMASFRYDSEGLSGCASSGNTLLCGFRRGNQYLVPFSLHVPNALKCARSGPEEEKSEQQAQPFKLKTAASASILRLHRVFGHAAKPALRELVRQGLVEVDAQTKADLNNRFTAIDCQHCKVAKAIKKPLPSKSSPPLSRDDGTWNFDVKGPLVASVTGKRWVGEATHPRTGLTKYFFLGKKSEAPKAIEELHEIASREGHPLKTLRLDYGGELDSDDFDEWAKAKGVQVQHSSPSHSEQNGMAERPLRTHSEGTAANLLQANLHGRHWPEAWGHSVFTKNRMPSSTRGNVTPYELYYGRKPDLSILAPFGCLAYARTPDQARRKADLRTGRARACIMLGYDVTSKDGYKLLHLETDRVVHSRSVTFMFDVFPLWEAEYNSKFKRGDSDYANFEPDGADLAAASPAEVAVTPLAVDNSPVETVTPPKTDASVPNRKSNRVTSAPFRFEPADYDANSAFAASDNAPDDPKTMKEAMGSHDRALWLEAIKRELQAHRKNQTWRYSKLPPDRKPIGCRWVFKKKRGPDGSVVSYKARLVAQGFSQRYGVDFQETFSPTPRLHTLRYLLAKAVLLGLDVHLADVDTAYLIPSLPEDERVYMRLPELPPEMDIGAPEASVAELLKCLYGLKQSGRYWNLHLKNTLGLIGFNPTPVDPCLYKHSKLSAYILIYVDDIIIAAPPGEMETIKAALAKRYTLKDLGRISWYLGMRFQYDLPAGKLSVSQAAYVKGVLATAKMEKCNPAPTPILERLHAPEGQPTEEELAFMNRVPYNKILGMLIWLTTCTRTDIAYAVNQLSRFANAPRLIHWKAMKRLLRYLKGMPDLGLQYTKDGNSEVVGYSDADWGGRADRKSTSGVCFTLAGCAIYWRSRTQRVVALSTAEAELIALTEAVKEAMHIGYLSREFTPGAKKQQPLFIYCDNQAAIIISSETRFSERTKHIDIRYFFCREKVEDGSVSIKFVPSQANLADFFTKPLLRVIFEVLREMLGMKMV